jgi:hypothetical protein
MELGRTHRFVTKPTVHDVDGRIDLNGKAKNPTRVDEKHVIALDNIVAFSKQMFVLVSDIAKHMNQKGGVTEAEFASALFNDDPNGTPGICATIDQYISECLTGNISDTQLMPLAFNGQPGANSPYASNAQGKAARRVDQSLFQLSSFISNGTELCKKDIAGISIRSTDGSKAVDVVLQ